MGQNVLGSHPLLSVFVFLFAGFFSLLLSLVFAMKTVPQEYTRLVFKRFAPLTAVMKSCEINEYCITKTVRSTRGRVEVNLPRFYVRTVCEYTIDGRTYTKDSKDNLGPFITMQEAYDYLQSLAPGQEFKVNYYFSDAISLDAAELLGTIKAPLQKNSVIDIQYDPSKPTRTSLDVEVNPANNTGLLFLYATTALIYVLTFILMHKRVSVPLLTSLTGLSIILAVILATLLLNLSERSHYLNKKPHFSFDISSSFSRDKMEPYLEKTE